MYKFNIRGSIKKELLAELINEFMELSEYSFSCDEDAFEIESEDINEAKKIVFNLLAKAGLKPPSWGILTGVRPVKLYGELSERCKNANEAVAMLIERYCLDGDKARDIKNIYEYQTSFTGKPPENSFGLYIGIPFCPTRCLYCSFTSNQVTPDEIAKYFEALKKEISSTGAMTKEARQFPESIYIGGGTPTTLTSEQLAELISLIHDSFDMSMLTEFTVEAGRPDTITEKKLKVLKSGGTDRISINPQSTNGKTLRIIGRGHTPDDIKRAFYDAGKVGFSSINADVIAGLPGEGTSDLVNSVNEMIALGADNITVHSLAVKRASRLIDIDNAYHYKRGRAVTEMLAASKELLCSRGYRPYYLYRLKHMAGAGENTGYCRDDKICLYNVRIMDEHQSVIALGSGGISKRYYPAENRLERVANVTDYKQYIDRIDEMTERKATGLFDREVTQC